MPIAIEQQAAIDREIVQAAVASTPETWTTVMLTVWRDPSNPDPNRLFVELSSPLGHAPVGGEMPLFEAVGKLDRLWQASGAMLKQATYTITLSDQGMSYKIAFEHLAPPNTPPASKPWWRRVFG